MAKLKLTPFQPKEYDEQCTVVAWAKLRESQCPKLKYLFATLNGVKLPIGLAVKMKKAGLKQGPLDILLPVPVDLKGGGHWCGLWVELKRRHGGVVSEAQDDWITFLRDAGYRAEVANGALEAIAIIAQYLGIKP